MITPAMARERFGNPVEERNMVLWDVPTDLEIGVIPKRIYCNRLLVQPLTAAFKALIATGCVNELRTWDGCFNIRPQRGNAKVASLHSWGLAVDVNAAWNALGAKHTLSAAFVKCFTDAGFRWGGRFKRPDGMHFELSNL